MPRLACNPHWWLRLKFPRRNEPLTARAVRFARNPVSSPPKKCKMQYRVACPIGWRARMKRVGLLRLWDL